MRTLAMLSLLACSCLPQNSPTMKPGEDCLRCHGSGNLRWYAAGTVFLDPKAAVTDGVQGVEVILTDSNNRRISLTSNGAGNFYTAETLVFPLTAEVKRGDKSLKMPDSVPQGGCNSCHTGGDIGRIYAP
jgi:hypothetical protein